MQTSAKMDANWEAKELRAAMKGLGTNEQKLIDTLCNKTAFEIESIVKAYRLQFPDRNLAKDIKSETSGNFRKTLLGLVTPRWNYKASYLHSAMKGLGTNERELIDVLTQSSNIDIRRISQVYAELYGEKKHKDKNKKEADKAKKFDQKYDYKHSYEGKQPVDFEKLAKDIAGETSFNFKKVLIALLRATRNEKGVLTNDLDSDVVELYKKGEGKIGTSDAFFIQVMTLRSPEHLIEVSKRYKNKYGKTLEEAIRSETSGDYRDALIALTKTPQVYFAERLQGAMKGLGTNDSALRYALVAHDPEERRAIAATYKKLFKKDLIDDIKSDTSGDYRKLLVAMIDPSKSK